MLLLGHAHARFEPKRVLFMPTVWGWLRGGRPMRLDYEHVVGLTLRARPRRGPGSLRISTRCAAEPFVLLFRRSQRREVQAVAEELAARARCRLRD